MTIRFVPDFQFATQVTRLKMWYNQNDPNHKCYMTCMKYITQIKLFR